MKNCKQYSDLCEHTPTEKTNVNEKLLNASQQNSQTAIIENRQSVIIWLLLVLISTLIIVLLSGKCLTFNYQ